jgi:hemerythrin superfamily protein
LTAETNKEENIMNAIQFLTQQHREVESLFNMLKEDTILDKEKDVIRTKIIANLQGHAKLEETYFYPEVAVKAGGAELVEHAQKEHEEIKELLGQWTSLENTSVGKQLEKAVMHHVKEEEEDMFPKVREIFTNTELDRMGYTLESNKAFGYYSS